MYRDSSAAPLLDLRRRLKAIMDVLYCMTLHGVSLSRSVELLLQWDRALHVGPLGLWVILLLQGIVVWVSLVGWWVIFIVGQCCQVVQGLHRRLSDFIHRVVVHRRDVAVTAWRSWLKELLCIAGRRFSGGGGIG